MADDRIEALERENAQDRRTRRLVEMFQRRNAEQAQDAKDIEAATKDAAKAFASKAQKMAKSTSWTRQAAKQMSRLASEAMKQAKQKSSLADPNNPFAQHQLVENVRTQMRQMAMALNPPPEVVDSPEFQELMDTLRPRSAKLNKSGFDKQSALQGKVRSDVLNRQVQEAVSDADRCASDKRVARLQEGGADRMAIESATKTLHQLAALLRKKKRKKKADVSDADAAAAPEEESVEVDLGDARELAQRALEVMRTLREEIAPQWAPNRQPWLINAADNEVYSILLAVIPRELFEQTEAYGEMQDLRAGQEVFTLRAADKTSEAVKRSK